MSGPNIAVPVAVPRQCGGFAPPGHPAAGHIPVDGAVRAAYPRPVAEAIEIDARGLKCPLPVLRAQRALRGLAPGAVLRLLADDPMAAIDVPHFCAEAGHGLTRPEPGVFAIRKAG